ncbi:MAG: HAMP domain-containing histidine kinase, partial [Ktedonobacterales bacterium]|nr:HAMP domain-containing histidine kinase [Ktedonobacterales bacterium]
DLTAIPAFALLALPIVLAGLLSGPRFVIATIAGAVLFTLAVILLTPHTDGLRSALAEPDGLVLFTVPLSTQIVIGLLMLAATRGYRRIQRELGDVRVAYAREKELERLKDQFIASVNHELRTPIMALQGYIEVARELGIRGDNARQAQMLERGAAATTHLAGIVRSVLDIRHIETDTASLRLATFAVRPAILNAIHLLDPRAGQGQERALRLDVPTDMMVYADEERVRQVLLNLLTNAIKYSPAGSPITISARLAAPSPARRRQRAAPPTLVEIAVRDRGLGIPPDQAVLLFQRFVRLERDIASPVVGTGLGLAICRAYVEAMNGRIWVESTGVPGEGATFTFTLPHAPPEQAPVEASSVHDERGRR